MRAGLQDRVLQVYQGCVYMDFDKALLEKDGHGLYVFLGFFDSKMQLQCRVLTYTRTHTLMCPPAMSAYLWLLCLASSWPMHPRHPTRAASTPPCASAGQRATRRYPTAAADHPCHTNRAGHSAFAVAYLSLLQVVDGMAAIGNLAKVMRDDVSATPASVDRVGELMRQNHQARRDLYGAHAFVALLSFAVLSSRTCVLRRLTRASGLRRSCQVTPPLEMAT